MKKAIKKIVESRIIRKNPIEAEFSERNWPVEVYFGSDYDYCPADECSE